MCISQSSREKQNLWNVHTHIYVYIYIDMGFIKNGFLQAVSNSSINTAMAAYQWKFPESSSCSIHEATQLSSSSTYTKIPKKQARIPETEWTRQQVQAGKEQKHPSPKFLVQAAMVWCGPD